jgi:uncharacterized membrane protein YhfC
MISQGVMNAILVQLIISLLLPIIVIIYLKKKNQLSWRSIGVGILIFIIFVHLLERAFHGFMINPDHPTELKWSDNPFYYVLYGIMAAALFEEFGRFIAYKFLLKRNRSLGDGLSYGLGHGGVEVLTIGIFGAVSAFLMVGLVNNGELGSVLGEQMNTEQIDTMKHQIINTPAYYYILSGVERVAALLMQIFLSILVLLGVKKGDMMYIWYAVFIHAVFNVAPALYQVGSIANIWLAEGIVILFGILSVFGMKRLLKQF